MNRTLRYKVRELPVSEFGAYHDFVKGMSDDSSQMIQMVGAGSDAEQTLTAWTKADPADPQPEARLGSLQMVQKHYKDAEASLNKAIVLTKEPDQLKLQLGQAQLKAGETDAGKKTLHALMDTSDDVDMLNGTAYELGDAGLDLSASETASRKAVQILETRTATVVVANATKEDFGNVANLAANWDTLGWIDFKENKLPEAEAFVQAAWLLLVSPEGGLHLGKIYEAEGKKEDALTTYRLAVKAMGQRQLPPSFADMKTEMEARIAELTKAGVHQKPGLHVEQGGDEVAALRTYTIPSPLQGQYASADFLLLLGDGHAQDVRFLKGDEALKKMTPALLAVTYRAPLPTGSKAKVLRRGIVACTTGSKTCLLVLVPAAEAQMDN
jgi:tetratricopeptide (TPR) repeat protein